MPYENYYPLKKGHAAYPDLYGYLKYLSTISYQPGQRPCFVGSRFGGLLARNYPIIYPLTVVRARVYEAQHPSGRKKMGTMKAPLITVCLLAKPLYRLRVLTQMALQIFYYQ
jgi:hypothetical protein